MESIFKILYISSLALGITAAIVTIFGFIKNVRLKFRIVVFILVLILTSASSFFWLRIEEIKENQKIEVIERNDAGILSESINISGDETIWELVGYLTQINGFYERYSEKYRVEEMYFDYYLEQWLTYLKNQPENEISIDKKISDIKELRGLVLSGEKHLEQISKK